MNNLARTATAALAGIGILGGVLGGSVTPAGNQAAQVPHAAVTTGTAWHKAATDLELACEHWTTDVYGLPKSIRAEHLYGLCFPWYRDAHGMTAALYAEAFYGMYKETDGGQWDR